MALASDATFTPGPWAFRPLTGDDGLGYIEAGGHDIMHAGVCDLSRETNEANARLIAAAPDLFEALQAARGFLPFNLPEGDGAELAGHLEAVWAQVDASLAKALGK